MNLHLFGLWSGTKLERGNNLVTKYWKKDFCHKFSQFSPPYRIDLDYILSPLNDA